MRKTQKKLTAELPQIGARFHVCLTGSGQLQKRMEAVDPGSFGLMLSGVKSDVISLVHGPLRKQFVEYYDANGGAVKSSFVDLNAAISDGNLDLEVGVHLAFGWELPSEMRNDTAAGLMSACFQYASAGVTRAEAILAAVSTPAAHLPGGISQLASLPPGVLQQAIQQQSTQASPTQMSIVSRASSDDGAGPGQYL